MSITVNGNAYTLVMTCCACPEQYDVLRDGKQVGYLRLRHGSFRVDCPDCGDETILHTTDVKGDGIFDCDERDGLLNQAIIAIDEHLRANPQILENTCVYTYSE